MNQNEKYILEDVALINKQYPRTFLIPSQEEIAALCQGMLVKLVFLLEEAEDECRAERMWVEITERQGDAFSGILTNDPRYIKTIEAGDTISFGSKHIAAIYITGEAPFDEKQFAIISKRALENRQINQVVRTDDLVNEQDSGWQFFFGDEDGEYLENSDNASIVLLEDVLSFEPLLEKILGEKGDYYEYSEQKNEFVRGIM